MKVKNIMFSGVMGVILMSVASSANAAISVASKAYVDTKASNVEAAYKAADETLDGKISDNATAIAEEVTARTNADNALDTRVTKNTEDIAANALEIEAVKDLTGTEGVATQIENALKVESDARAAAVLALQNKDTELAGDISANTAAIGALNDTYVSEEEMTAFQTTNTAAIADAKKAGTDAADALAEYKTTNDAAVQKNASDIAALDTTYVSESELNTFKTSNTEAIADAKKAGTDAADALAAYKTTNDAAVADAKKAGTDAADALAAYKTTNDAAVQKNASDIAALDTTYVSESELNTFKTSNTEAIAAAKSGAEATAAEALAAYKTTNDVAVQKNASDIAALDTTYVSESELNTFKTSNTEAIADAKKAGTDAADALAEYKTTNDAAVAANKTATETNAAAIETKVDQSDYDTKVTEIENDLLTKIEMPAACETQDCVLSINKASGTVSWTPLTEPVADFINQQN